MPKIVREITYEYATLDDMLRDVSGWKAPAYGYVGGCGENNIKTIHSTIKEVQA